MKAVFLLLCIFAVTCYGSTSTLKFKLHNSVHQGEEEALLPSAPEEPVYTVSEPVPEEAAPIAEEPVYTVSEPVYQEAPQETGEESVYTITAEPVYSVGEPVYQEAPEKEPVYVAPQETGEETFYVSEEPVYSVGEPVYQETPEKEPLYVAPQETSEEALYTTYAPIYEEPIPVEQPVALGGWYNVDVSRLDHDEDLQAALDLGVDTLLQTAREDGKLPRSESAFRVKTVTQIQQQTVAGINNKFNVVLENSEDGRIYAEFLVFRGLDRTVTVVEGCLKVGRVIRI